jgi:hypothetical protein
MNLGSFIAALGRAALGTYTQALRDLLGGL